MPIIDQLKEGSSTQRGGLNHQAIEDYLKTIYSLAQEESPVSTSRLSEARAVKPASATGMIRRLADLKLVNYEKHRGVTLTREGERIALEVLRHHRLIELYLIQALGYTWDEVHEEADILEHVISEKLEDKIAAALGYPKFDPHGAPIPSKDGSIETVASRPLASLKVGDSAEVVRVGDADAGEMLRYLDTIGLRPGTCFSVTAIAPFDGPITIEIKSTNQQAGSAEHILGFKVASSVLVT